MLQNYEKKEFETPPLLTASKRRYYFELTPWSRKIVSSLYTPDNKIGFILQLGYFRRTNRFFIPSLFHIKDIEYVAASLKVGVSVDSSLQYPARTYRRHQETILRQLGFKRFDTSYEDSLEAFVLNGCRRQVKPRSLFWGLVEYIKEHNREVPSYHTIGTIISNGFWKFEQSLQQLIQDNLTEEDKALLDALLEKDVVSKKLSRPLKQYRLTLMKSPHHATKTSQILKNSNDFLIVQTLFDSLYPLLEKLSLTPETIRYYAQRVISSKIFQIQQREEGRYLFLIAFIIHHYYILNDALVDALLQTTNETNSQCRRKSKEIDRLKHQGFLKSVKTMSNQVRSYLSISQEIHNLLLSEDLSSEEKVIQSLALYSDCSPLEEEIEAGNIIIEEVCDKGKKDDRYYELLKGRSLSVQKRLSSLIKTLVFDTGSSNSYLLDALDYYRETNGKGTNPPIEIFSKTARKYLNNKKGKVDISLYKVLLFVALAKGIKGGSLNLYHSYIYRRLSHYLIPDDEWQQNRELLLAQSGLVHLKSYASVEKFFNPLLKAGYKEVNNKIAQGKNPYIIIKEEKVSTVETPPREECDLSTTADLFPNESCVSILEILNTVNEITGFTDAFTHWNHTHVHHKPHDKSFFAALLGYGTNLGISRFSQMSKDITPSELETIGNWYLSLQNLKEANDRVVTAITKMELSLKQREDPDVIHTSSDGQKVNVSEDSIYASYSQKYFGKGRGVSVMSFTDETYSVPYSTVINASEREATYVIDGLMHNDVIQSDRHSTDTHGYTEAVFAITHLLGIYFTPRLKSACKEKLYSLDEPLSYSDDEYPYFKPAEKIDTAIIQQEWDNILQFTATIKLKRNNASQLFQRLNSYSGNHPLRKALTELGKMVKTRFLLNYFDSLEFRQSTGKQLNKGENTNRFRKAISFGNNREFQQGSKIEMNKACDANTLIQNGCILWNYLYLSQLIVDAKTTEERTELLDIIKRGSVVTWHHINFHGQYNFSEEEFANSLKFVYEQLKKLNL